MFSGDDIRGGRKRIHPAPVAGVIIWGYGWSEARPARRIRCPLLGAPYGAKATRPLQQGRQPARVAGEMSPPSSAPSTVLTAATRKSLCVSTPTITTRRRRAGAEVGGVAPGTVTGLRSDRGRGGRAQGVWTRTESVDQNGERRSGTRAASQDRHPGAGGDEALTGEAFDAGGAGHGISADRVLDGGRSASLHGAPFGERSDEDQAGRKVQAVSRGRSPACGRVGCSSSPCEGPARPVFGCPEAREAVCRLRLVPPTVVPCRRVTAWSRATCDF